LAWGVVAPRSQTHGGYAPSSRLAPSQKRRNKRHRIYESQYLVNGNVPAVHKEGWRGSGYGVPALAGGVSLIKTEGRYLTLLFQISPCRLKPGLHTPRAFFARKQAPFEFSDTLLID